MHITLRPQISLQKVNACGKIILCGVKCTTCPTCNQTCPDFVKERCNRLDKAPYVCNGCPKQSITARLPTNTAMMLFCWPQIQRMSLTVQGRYKHDQTRTASERYGHHAPDFQGQSPYQIITNHPELDMSVRTLYSYLDKGILSARNIDLKRQVKFKPRKVHKTQIKDRSVLSDVCFLISSPWTWPFAEMDTVHSSQDSKRVILTFFLTRENCFLHSLWTDAPKVP